MVAASATIGKQGMRRTYRNAVASFSYGLTNDATALRLDNHFHSRSYGSRSGNHRLEDATALRLSTGRPITRDLTHLLKFYCSSKWSNVSNPREAFVMVQPPQTRQSAV